jgi:hypothetical protein
MSTATITQAQDKGLRHQFADSIARIREFAIELFVAHGGWFVQDADRSTRKSRRELLSLAAAAESHSPSLSAELRHLASK